MTTTPPSSDRGRRGRAFTLITPANHYPSRLPGLQGGHVVKLVTPRLAPARFSELLFVLEGDGHTTMPVPTRGHGSFLYALDGLVAVSADDLEGTLSAGGFLYLPPGGEHLRLRAGADGARVLWLSKAWEPWPGIDPAEPVAGHRDDEPFERVEPAGLTRRELLDPTDPRHDFNVSLLRFDPGVTLGKVEVHDEEHGLWMTAGQGRYLLDTEELEVFQDDFVYMAPYCPQGFTATGDVPAEYLLYKDVYRR